ncbi:MAG: signal recognition particle-docking protein FtsY [Streptosporangiales bacterium]|nr:signal recognition particle-docking protein FtsY [Streptosporangiales bacterium]
MELIAFYIAIGVVVVLGLVGLVAGVRRRSAPPRADRQPPAPSAPVEQRPPAPAGTKTVPTQEPEAPEAVEAIEDRVEVPAPVAGRLVRLRARLARSQSTLGRGLLSLLSRDTLDEDTWEEVEETLLAADVGVRPTTEIVENLRTRVRVLGTRTPDQLRDLLREELLYQLGTDQAREVKATRDDGKPAVVLVVGVNGTGKTTTVGKLGRVLVADGKRVLLGAADTFRAAAVDQLATWGSRVGAETVRGAEGADPASVAFEAVRAGIEQGVDAVLVDTAGRLHTKQGLMDELGKVKRVVEKQAPVDEVLLVLDATTGQNGLVQARIFAEVVDVTGLVLTKLDGTAKGGIVIAVQRELGVPVKLVGLGEGADDLAPFVPGDFVDALLAVDDDAVTG